MTANSPFQSVAEACAAAQSWDAVVDNVVEHLITEDECFSSGEIVTHIRTHRSDLRFKHSWVGERLQNSFVMAAFPSYDKFGSENPPHQVTRQTSGLGRTPAGITVFVYGPSVADAQAHHFEVDVPRPGVSQDGSPDGQGVSAQGLSMAAAALMGGLGNVPPTPVQPVAAPSQPPIKVVTAYGKNIPGDVLAKVHSDGRICIPKLAFEALAKQSGQPIVGGEPLYATWNGLVVEINQGSGLSTIYPTTDHCRVHLTPPSASTLKAGQEFACTANPQGLIIDLGNPV